MSLREKRIAELEDMLAARSDGDGKARPGYTRNVIAIRQELERLRAMGSEQTTPTPPAKDPNESD